MAGVDALVPIGSVTLTSAQPSVTFGSLPQGFRDLRIVLNVSGVANDIALQFNGDTSSNYSRTFMVSQSSGVGFGNDTTGRILIAYAGGGCRLRLLTYWTTWQISIKLL